MAWSPTDFAIALCCQHHLTNLETLCTPCHQEVTRLQQRNLYPPGGTPIPNTQAVPPQLLVAMICMARGHGHATNAPGSECRWSRTDGLRMLGPLLRKLPALAGEVLDSPR